MLRIRTAILVALLTTTALVFSAPCRADCAPGAKAAAIGFMNAYVKQVNAIENKQTNIEMEQWLRTNSKLTAHFKNSYQKLVDGAKTDDPESGLDFDPIVNAQDMPDNGFELERCESSGYIVLRGVDWPTFSVAVKVVSTPAGWMVEGAGVINIPDDKQAHMK